MRCLIPHSSIQHFLKLNMSVINNKCHWAFKWNAARAHTQFDKLLGSYSFSCLAFVSILFETFHFVLGFVIFSYSFLSLWRLFVSILRRHVSLLWKCFMFCCHVVSGCLFLGAVVSVYCVFLSFVWLFLLLLWLFYISYYLSHIHINLIWRFD